MDLHAPVDYRTRSWWAKFDSDVNWPNSSVDDYPAYFSRFKMQVDFTPLSKYLANCKTLEGMLTMPAICKTEDLPVPSVKKTVIVDDQVHKPAAALAAVVPEVNEICRNFGRQMHVRIEMQVSPCEGV